MSGYSVLSAEGMDDALDMARSCPFLETGGTIEVAEMKEFKKPSDS